ncbi:cadherin-like domain-containing protein [Alteromonas sp. ALT199]|uniref:Ig-like domain-containing protein n=1 Tax=unclassified Alteromonas TaxID=2614992 RepID=UPI001BEA830C|nr:cadherin-like domain-containing protein [Alteromonas sp. ALT199]
MYFKIRLLSKKSDKTTPKKQSYVKRQQHRMWIASGLVLALSGCFDSDDDNNYQAPEENVAPVAVDQMLTTQADIAFDGTLTATDEDGDALTFGLGENGSLGSAEVNTDGTFTYTPKAQVTGSDSFTFTVSDGVNPEVTASVSITIEAQQVSFSSYTRDAFYQAPTDEPLPINGREFTQDANDSTFDDLLIDQ